MLTALAKATAAAASSSSNSSSRPTEVVRQNTTQI